jgi:hypothetical protein
MAATKAQGRWYGAFLAGLTTTCAGIAGFGGGGGKAVFVIGLIVLAVTFFKFVQLKPLEGKPALGAQPAAMKALGVLLALAGWIIVLLGLHFTSAVSARLVITILGMVVTLVGILGILPAACNKNAIWKA